MWVAVKAFFRTAVPGVIKPLRILWNEMIAFIFAVFAVILGFQVFRDFSRLDATPEKIAKVAFLAVFALIMAGYAIHSFARSKKISRS